KAAVDAAEGVERRLHRCRDRGRIGDVANPAVDLAGTLRHGGRRRLVLVGIAAPDRDVAATQRKRLGNAKPDTAVTAGNHGHAAGEVEQVHGTFPRYDAHQPSADASRPPWTTPPQKSNMGSRPQHPLQALKLSVRATAKKRKRCNSSTARSIST